jgi:hypothetical protein
MLAPDFTARFCHCETLLGQNTANKPPAISLQNPQKTRKKVEIKAKPTAFLPKT